MIEKEKYPMRINKYLAFKKHSTRRGADELIIGGKVFLNGKLAVLGDKVNEADNVEVRFRGKVKPYLYFAYNKPRGIVTHSAQNDDKDIDDELFNDSKGKKMPKEMSGVFPIGRLDKDSYGLIILTNDGRITERLLGPEFAHEKEYVVKTANPLRASFKKNIEALTKIEKDKIKPCKVEVLSNNLFKIILTEGKKHQIRRMCSAVFQEIESLKRVRVMNIELGKLGEGQYRKIEGKELEVFLKSLDLA